MGKVRRGVSIIACTNNPKFIRNIFSNYKRQKWRKKELIIIVNRDDISLRPYKAKAKKFKNVSVYRLPGRTTLGRCLNYGVSRSRYPIISKFDHDDYYSPFYLRRSMKLLRRKNIDVVGKQSVFLYMQSRKSLYVWCPKNENRYRRFVAGGTIMFKKKVFKRVKFANRTVGEDVRFLRDCRRKGFKIFSGDRFNYVYTRRKNRGSHTWKAKDSYLIQRSRFIARTARYKRLVIRR